MQITLKGRQCGKTHEMVKKTMSTEKAIMIVFSKKEKDRIIELYKSEYPNIAKKVLFLYETETRHGMYPYGWDLYVDNADLILQRFLGGNIKGITMTKEPYIIEDLSHTIKIKDGMDD